MIIKLRSTLTQAPDLTDQVSPIVERLTATFVSLLEKSIFDPAVLSGTYSNRAAAELAHLLVDTGRSAEVTQYANRIVEKANKRPRPTPEQERFSSSSTDERFSRAGELIRAAIMYSVTGQNQVAHGLFVDGLNNIRIGQRVARCELACSIVAYSSATDMHLAQQAAEIATEQAARETDLQQRSALFVNLAHRLVSTGQYNRALSLSQAAANPSLILRGYVMIVDAILDEQMPALRKDWGLGVTEWPEIGGSDLNLNLKVRQQNLWVVSGSGNLPRA